MVKIMAVVIPCLIATTSEAQTLLTTWNVLCEYSDKVKPPLTIVGSLLYSYTSWMRHRVGTGAAPWWPFAVAAVLTLAIVPFTLTVMAPMCNTLFQNKTATKMSRDEAVIAVQHWTRLHTVRTLLPVTGAVLGFMDVLELDVFWLGKYVYVVLEDGGLDYVSDLGGSMYLRTAQLRLATVTRSGRKNSYVRLYGYLVLMNAHLKCF